MAIGPSLLSDRLCPNERLGTRLVLVLWINSFFTLLVAYSDANLKISQSRHRGPGMAQWWENSSRSNVARVQFLPGAMCGLSLLLVSRAAPRGFLRVLQTFCLRKINISKFQFGQDEGLHWWKPAKANAASCLNTELRFTTKNTSIIRTLVCRSLRNGYVAHLDNVFPPF